LISDKYACLSIGTSRPSHIVLMAVTGYQTWCQRNLAIRYRLFLLVCLHLHLCYLFWVIWLFFCHPRLTPPP